MIHRKAKAYEIMEAVYKSTGIDPSQICSASRHKDVTLARTLFIVLCREFTVMSYPEIGRHLSRQGHSGIVEAYNRASRPDVADAIREKKEAATDYLRGCNGVLWRDET